MIAAAKTELADYGEDAPGIRRGLLLTGAAICSFGTAAALLAGQRAWLALIAGVLALMGLVPLCLGLAMVAYRYRGKPRVRDRLLDSVAWRGDEIVLDVGTGAGLLLVGAALRAPAGRVMGIDIWAAKDLSANSEAATWRNARIAGVADRVEVLTRDARALDFPAGHFDRIISLLCLHNIEPATDRREACAEIARVLKPGGFVMIGDYLPTSEYAGWFCDAGLRVVSNGSCFRTALSLMWIVVAEKPVEIASN